MNESLARQLFNEHKKKLDLLKGNRPPNGLKLAISRIFGDRPEAGKIVRIGRTDVSYSGGKGDVISFLPVRWLNVFNKVDYMWRGCENWWAGYPLIILLEFRTNTADTTGHVNIIAEVGPVSDHRHRKKLIKEIKLAALERSLIRISFSEGASDKGRLYSRFLSDNSCLVTNASSADEIEDRIFALVSSFEGEFEVIERALQSVIAGNTV